MPRSVNAVASRARRKKVLKQTKGYFGDVKTFIRLQNMGNAEHGMSYSDFMGKLKGKMYAFNLTVRFGRFGEEGGEKRGGGGGEDKYWGIALVGGGGGFAG